jgi:putative nucleotidyltransferase with HDIG domain
VSITPKELTGNITKLTSFPSVAFRINEAFTDENSSTADFVALIEPDPALSVALLRIANSSLYGVGGTVSTVERAVMIVGLREIRDLAFGICASTTFQGIPNDLVSVKDFWKHSLYCASAAQSLGKKAKIRTTDSLFTAGLLHDIGELVMFNQNPELSRAALELSLDENDGVTSYLAERKVFGFDHAEVGAELARQWCLPDSLRACIEFHHSPFDSDISVDAVLIVHLANSIAVLAELNSLNLDDAPQIDKRTFEKLGLSPDVIPDTVAETQESVTELLRIFLN